MTMNTPIPNTMLEQVPSIWPLGHGCVMTSFAMAEGVPMFFFRAVRDELIGKPGQPATMDSWEACDGAPTLTLAFAGKAAVDRLIGDLQQLSAAIQAVETGVRCPHCQDTGMTCEQHPSQPWPHDDCIGPGEPCSCQGEG